MKKSIIISIIFILVFCQNIFAQPYYEQTNVQVGINTYNCIKDDIFLTVSNANNILNTQVSNLNKESYLCIGLSRESFWPKVKNILLSTLTLQKIETFKGHPSNLISLRCWIDKQGKILELRFGLARNTKITPNELATIEHRFKSEITFDIDCSVNSDLNFIEFVVPINFKAMFSL
jgi:hypothetical protein